MKRYYKAKQQMDGVWALTNSNEAIYVIEGREKAMAFDTGFGFVDPLPYIREITDKPLTVLCSHGHFDHIGGNRFFEGPVYFSRKELETARRHTTPEYHLVGYQDVLKFQKLLPFLHWIPKDMDVEAYLHEQPYENYVYIEDGYKFDLGSVTLEVLELPGHTPAGLSLYCPEKKLMLTSDAANPNVFLFLPESETLSVYTRSLRHALEKDFDSFFVAHSTKLRTRAEFEDYLATAENLDWENGQPTTHELRPDMELRRCTKRGRKPSNRVPCLLIARDKL